ncbi:CBASS oligonucleotide cyclase [Streptomyces sp. NPDC101225]|uniref:CBASS oligonucleotide cyclase n=1 Tax=Streptomyces sp. NPDC101225 TaxID=3366135 RepID=UPI0037F7F480
MGGGSGGWGEAYDAELARQQRESAVEKERRLSEINDFLAEQLTAYNDRDTSGVQSRLDQISQLLSDVIDGGIDRMLFGGSVAKHTYVDGLSDVDALVVVRSAGANSPAELLNSFAETLRARLPGSSLAEVSAGTLAVTVRYADGLEVQLLPAVERGGRLAIASGNGQTWQQIRPRKFAEKLTEVNKNNSGGVVPAIKLAKSLLEKQLPSTMKLGGYHLEAIAVDAFRSYHGSKSREAMLDHLVRHASTAVLNPTGDITGQSVHVDSDLGAANSSSRQRLAAALRRISTKLESGTIGEYREMFSD